MFYGPALILHLKNSQQRQLQVTKILLIFGDCDFESVNNDQVLSEIIQDAYQQKYVQSLSNSNVKTFCGPQFHSVGQVQIHYHVSNNSIDNNQNWLFNSYSHFS